MEEGIWHSSAQTNLAILSLPYACFWFDRESNDPYVEVKDEKGKFERKKIKTGISDGINVEILSGLEMSDQVKVWNKTEPIKIDEDED